MGTLWRGCLPHFRQTKRINPLFWHPSCSIKGFHRRWPAQSASDIESGKSGQLTHIESWSWSKRTFPTLFCTTLALPVPSVPLLPLSCRKIAHFCSFCSKGLKSCEGLCWTLGGNGESSADLPSKRQVGTGRASSSEMRVQDLWSALKSPGMNANVKCDSYYYELSGNLNLPECLFISL